MVGQPGKRGAQVVAVEAEATEPAPRRIGAQIHGLPCEVGEIPRVALTDRQRFGAGYCQTFERVLANRLEQTKADLTVELVGDDERPIHKTGQEFNRPVTAQGFGGLERPAAGEDGHTPNCLARGFVEQVVAPVDRGAQPLMARRCATHLPFEQRHTTFGQTGQDLVDAEDVHVRRG
jgi:hypothetical protein